MINSLLLLYNTAIAIQKTTQQQTAQLLLCVVVMLLFDLFSTLSRAILT
jgi:hypothetical protein